MKITAFFWSLLCLYSVSLTAADEMALTIGTEHIVSPYTYPQKGINPQKDELVAYLTPSDNHNEEKWVPGKVESIHEAAIIMKLGLNKSSSYVVAIQNQMLHRIYGQGDMLDDKDAESLTACTQEPELNMLVVYKGLLDKYYVGRVKERVMGDQYSILMSQNKGRCFPFQELLVLKKIKAKEGDKH